MNKVHEGTQNWVKNNIIISERTKKSTSLIVNESLLTGNQHDITIVGNESTDKLIM